MERLLIAEDEKKLRVLMRDFFEVKGYEVVEAEDGIQAVVEAKKQPFDLIFLDIMMPGMDGMEACEQIRQFTDAPIVFLTAVHDDESKLKGYACGADDYLTKPFSLDVLYAKAKAMTNRYKGNVGAKPGIIKASTLSLDTTCHVAHINGKVVDLASKEYEILKLFLENKGQIISRGQILDRVWGEEYFGYDRTVDTHVKKLRKSIGEAAEPLQTVYKAGYVWKE